MDWLEERIATLRQENMNCSQTMMQLSLELRGMDNPELIQSMFGLGGGLHCMHVCGTLTSGCCLLASYGENGEAPTASRSIRAMINEYVQWFEGQYGSLICKDLISGDRANIPAFCPGLIKENYLKCIEMLEDSGINPEE